MARERSPNLTLVQLPGPAGGPTPDGMSAGERLRLAHSILQYNQGFVTFVDGKANTLLLVNSIFLATASSAGLGHALALGAAVGAAATVLLCLSVVFARMPAGPSRRDRARLHFFADVRARRNAMSYVEDLQACGAGELFESTAVQTFELAGVVERKFRAYRWAQLATFGTAALWLCNLARPLLAAISDHTGLARLGG